MIKVLLGAIAGLSVAAIISGLTALCPKAKVNDYDAWTSGGYHLMICDNGTPNDPEDDYIYDWEDNRIFEISVKD